MKKNVYIIIAALAALVLIAAAIYYFKYYMSRKTPNQNPVVEKASDFTLAPGAADTKEKVIYFKRTDGGNEIRQYDLAKKEDKLIFSDSSQEIKINLIGGYADLKDEILAYIGTDSSGKLMIISAASGETAIINQSFAKPTALAISPDGQNIVYSNAQANSTKFAIIEMKRDGTNKRQLFESESTLTALALSRNDGSVAFISASGKKTAIDVLDIATLKNNEIYSSNNQILSIQFHQNGKIIFSEGQNGNIQSGRAFVIDADGGSLKKIFATKKDYPASVAVSSDFSVSAFILTTFTDKFEINKQGSADFIKVGDESINKIGDANLIIGWRIWFAIRRPEMVRHFKLIFITLLVLIMISAGAASFFYAKTRSLEKKVEDLSSAKSSGSITATNTTNKTTTPVVTPTVPAAAGNRPSSPSDTVIVATGETLMTIGSKTGVSWLAIADANGIDPNKIQAGQTIIIPKNGQVNFTVNPTVAQGLQKDVDSGKYAQRLDPAATAQLDAPTVYGLTATDTFTATKLDQTSLSATVTVSKNNKTYTISLVQPVTKGAKGIWAIESIRPSAWENF